MGRGQARAEGRGQRLAGRTGGGRGQEATRRGLVGAEGRGPRGEGMWVQREEGRGHGVWGLPGTVGSSGFLPHPKPFQWRWPQMFL